MEQSNSYKDEHPLRFTAVVGTLLFCAGLAIGLIADTGTSAATPRACRDALELDDEIIMTVGTRIGAYDFTGAATYLNEVTDERHALYAGCMEA